MVSTGLMGHFQAILWREVTNIEDNITGGCMREDQAPGKAPAPLAFDKGVGKIIKAGLICL